MDHILLHTKTRLELEQFITGGNHALLLAGKLGSGSYSIAIATIELLLKTSVTRAPYFLHVNGSDKAIGIEDIRSVQSFLQRKTTGTNRVRRAVLLETADSMNVEAQNALLKSLEEPPLDTVIVLTASLPQLLKPTIHSRLQHIEIRQVPIQAALSHFSSTGASSLEIEKAYKISDGQMGLMTLLLNKTAEHPLYLQLITAKKLYAMTTFERLSQIDTLLKDKDSLPELLYACKRICSSALEQAATKKQKPQLSVWHKQLALICEAEDRANKNNNTKLLLTDLFMRM